MGLGWALVRAANAGGGSAFHGPAVAFERGASIQGLKRIERLPVVGSKARSSGLCFLMQAVVTDAPCWITQRLPRGLKPEPQDLRGRRGVSG